MSDLLASIAAQSAAGTLPPREQTHDEKGRRQVTSSHDFQRVFALPRRIIFPHDHPENAHVLAPLYQTQRYRLNSVQEHALIEAPQAKGALVAAGVGYGKTLIGQLMPMVMKGCRTALLLLPNQGVESFLNQWALFEPHFTLPNLAMPRIEKFTPGRPTLHVVSYSKLSHESGTNLLSQLKPDLLIFDEIHALKNEDAVRTDRVLRHVRANETALVEGVEIPVRKVGMSGTICTKSYRDYAHIVWLLLGIHAPVPKEPSVVTEWAEAIDPLPWNIRPGVLKRFCLPNETVRSGLQRRERETLGWIATTDSSAAMTLTLAGRSPSPKIPNDIHEKMDKLRKDWTRPDGEEFAEAKDVVITARQLACGFFYRWVFPRGEPPELIERWRNVRKMWHRELRRKLERRTEHMDSAGLLTRAAMRFMDGYEGELPVWNSEYFPAWREIRKQVEHETRAVWIDDYLARDAAEWAAKHTGIVWFEHAALGKRIQELSGLRLYRGDAHEGDIEKETGDESIIVSADAFYHIKNLQMFSDQLLTTVMPNAARLEQLIGRTHRQGQAADEVRVEMYRHVPEMVEAFERAEELAQFLLQTKGARHKILFAQRESW